MRTGWPLDWTHVAADGDSVSGNAVSLQPVTSDALRVTRRARLCPGVTGAVLVSVEVIDGGLRNSAVFVKHS